MSLFDTDYNVLVKLLTPRQLRNTNMVAWLKVLVCPVNYVYNLFMTQRYDNLYILQHSPQVCYMQAVLNDAFDSALRRIKIVDGPENDPVYIYKSAELKPVPTYTETESNPVVLYTSAETASFGPDFIVQVPHGISFDEVYMRALIDRFRLASKNNYLIQLA